MSSVASSKQVMLDRDLARLYGVETRVLNQAVQRNIERFPEDFMFQLTKEEAELLRSQFATLDDDPEDLRSQNATSSGDVFSRSQFVTLNEQIDIKGYYCPIAILIFRAHFRARNIFFR